MPGIGTILSLVLFGYILPLFVVLPVANALRTILEHAETNPQNLFHCATFYRTGLLTRFLFFWDAGDCHLVHHIFPNIPFYRMGKAVEDDARAWHIQSVPEGVLAHATHTWVAKDDSGDLRLGVDGFAGAILGGVDRVVPCLT